MASNPALVADLKAAVGAEYVLHEPEDLIVYEYDGSVDRALPAAVALPASTEEVSAVVRAARRHGAPIVARGAGTGLSGGAIAHDGGVVATLTRMNRILEVDVEDRIAVVEPGGPHCLAYGVTTNHGLGLEIVTADGSVQWLGGRTRESAGYDLRGVMIGSEGTLAIVTKVVVRLLRKPEAVKTLLAVFSELDHASAAVSGVIGAGIVPAAIEMMDELCIQAVEPAVHAGYPSGAGAVLLVEVDGLREAVEEEVDEVERVCNRFDPMEIRTATDPEERERLWAGRKGVLGALGRLAPNYYLVDGTIPRTRLVEVLARIRALSAEYGLPIANLLHAGDGNLHPSVLFDERNPEELRKTLEIGGRILELCIEVGGVLSGEHGIGLEKQEYFSFMFDDDDMEAMARLKPAFATDDLFNPGKIFPSGASCVDMFQSAAISRAGAGAYI